MSEDIKDVNVENDVTPSQEENLTENLTENNTEYNSEYNAEVNTSEEQSVSVEETPETSDSASEEDNEVKTVDYNAVEDDDDDDEEVQYTKSGKPKKHLTHAQKRKRTITALISTGSVLAVLVIFICSVAVANVVGVKALLNQAKSFQKVVYAGHQFEKGVDLNKDADGYWTFTTDDEFKVLQLTDVHIGGGSFSQNTDMWAMNAVATMIGKEQPDLVIVTGDIAFPVPYASGSFNNLSGAQIFANMMESLGVYWTFAFGNHDTEAYSMKTREEICQYYEREKFNYCLFERGFSSEERGYGNNIIKVKNTAGIVTQALVTFDSHSYIEGDYFGMAWKYDNIHQSQIDWYKGEMQKLVTANKAIDSTYQGPVKNMAFFHIPLVEYREAWSKVIESGEKNLAPEYEITRDGTKVKFHYGAMGESDKQKNGQRTYGVFCGLHEDNLFEVGYQNGLRGTFCGHDHYNNFSVDYTKTFKGENGEDVEGTIRLTYGMSIDYLAYPGIYKEHLQRGCTVITIESDGSFDCVQKNYYTDYGVAHEKD